MRVEHGKIERSFRLTEKLKLHGMATRDVTVAANGVLYLHGTVCGNLNVEADGTAFVDGTVVGSVVNDGGHVEIRGSVGRVVKQSGTTQVDPDAHVNGRSYGAG